MTKSGFNAGKQSEIGNFRRDESFANGQNKHTFERHRHTGRADQPGRMEILINLSNSKSGLF
jgi:hypothetical protein